jgi:hypothetical protein
MWAFAAGVTIGCIVGFFAGALFGVRPSEPPDDGERLIPKRKPESVEAFHRPERLPRRAA